MTPQRYILFLIPAKPIPFPYILLTSLLTLLNLLLTSLLTLLNILLTSLLNLFNLLLTPPAKLPRFSPTFPYQFHRSPKGHP